MAEKHTPEEFWHSILTGDNPPLPLREMRNVLALLPANPRCTFCNAPFSGVGAPLMRLIGRSPSTLTPHLCRLCHDASRNHIGGAELEMTFLFADIRGSTALAEKMSAAEFGRLINRFYSAATDVLFGSGAWSDRLVGDEVIGIYVPGFAGPQHAAQAVHASQRLMTAMGYGPDADEWLPVGVGIHTGIAFAGAVGRTGSAVDITALGDNVNVAARLASKAASGEVLISETAYQAAGIELGPVHKRVLELKGKSEPVTVYAWTAPRRDSQSAAP
jgi:adenylate cyclase